MPSLINIDLVPNFENDDFEIIKNLIENPEKFNIPETEKEIKKILASYFPNSEIYFFNSARSALTFLLNNLNTQIVDSDKTQNSASVITQAFSCLVVPNAIKFAGLKPVYVDIDESFNLDIDDLKRKISKETKAIIIQNTFGLPAKIDEILAIAKENKLFIIENLTHSLGAKYNNIYLGNFGETALLSFNRNKVISSIIGGALVIKDKNLNQKIQIEYERLPELTPREIKKILLTGKILYQARENYNLLTKIYLKILRKIGLITEMVPPTEKLGQQPKSYLAKFPKILFPLLANQLKKLENFNRHRQDLSKIYLKWGLQNFEIDQRAEPIFLRFPVLVNKRDYVLDFFKKHDIYLGDWYNCVLAPCSKLENFDYQIGSCPYAESITKKIINLPTYIGVSFKSVEKIIQLIKK